MTTKHHPSPWRSFAPFYGILVGSCISWAAIYFAGISSTAPELWAGRLQAIINSLLMWSMFTALLQNKEIYGGGLVERDGDDGRLIWLAMTLFLIWVLSLLSFVTNRMLLFYGLSFAMSAGLAGEIGWRDPARLFGTFSRRGKR